MQQIQMGLLPAGFRILTAVAHHGTHCGESAAYVGIDFLTSIPSLRPRIEAHAVVWANPFDYEDLRQTIQQAVASAANLPGAD